MKTIARGCFPLALHAILAALALLLLATRTEAVDLTGTWAPASASGLVRCKYVTGDGTGSESQSLSLAVTQTSGRLTLTGSGPSIIFCPGSLAQGAGWVVSNFDDADRGDALAVSCADVYSQAVQFSKAKTFAPDAEGTTGTAKVTITLTDVDACLITCKGKFKRTSTTDPAVPDCP